MVTDLDKARAQADELRNTSEMLLSGLDGDDLSEMSKRAIREAADEAQAQADTIASLIADVEQARADGYADGVKDALVIAEAHRARDHHEIREEPAGYTFAARDIAGRIRVLNLEGK